MQTARDLRSGKQKYLLAFMFLIIISVVSVSFSMGSGEGYDPGRREILLRKIGDELLLNSGDRTSRVMPVKKVGENEFQISFENELFFQPDSLVNIIRRVLAGDRHALNYVVNVLNCGSSGVTYGFAISKNRKDDIISCKGRVQPKACYVVNIKFQAAKTKTIQYGYLVGGLALLGFMGFIFFRSEKPRNVLPENQSASPGDHSTSPGNQSTNMFTLGAVLFDAQHRKLMVNEKTIDLTGTETRVLSIFALSPNETIERSRLQKEIWEDEGVIVGRSLDMFISKLRKKLEVDPAVKIVVIRGKGYKLAISS